MLKFVDNGYIHRKRQYQIFNGKKFIGYVLDYEIAPYSKEHFETAVDDTLRTEILRRLDILAAEDILLEKDG